MSLGFLRWHLKTEFLQNNCLPLRMCIFRFLLSKLHPGHSSSRCSCDSSMGPLQKLHERLSRCELLWFILIPFIILALTLIHSLLLFRVMYVMYVLSLGSSLTLSPTFVLAVISSRLVFWLWILMALLISPFDTSQNLTSLSPISSARSLHSWFQHLYL